MASTPTPTPNYSSVPPRPSENHHHHNSSKLKETCHHHRRRHSHSHWSSYSNSNPSPLAVVAVAAAVAAETGAAGSGSSNLGGAGSSAVAPSVASFRRSGNGTSPPAYFSSLGSYLGARKSRLAPEFSGRWSTQFATTMHSGRPRITPNNHPHTKAAEEALHCLLKAGDNSVAIDNILFSFEHKLWGCEDYIFLLKEFGNSGHLLQAEKCFDFGICKNDGRVTRGKLTSTMIGTLGKLGRIEQALSLFEGAKKKGHGNTVYSFSAMISAYGRNRCFPEAVDLFRSMTTCGLEPNIITYNALIDAGAKSEVDFDMVAKFFDELVTNNLKPDRVTYNSLLSACAPKGLWELAQNLLREMEQNGIDRDLFTYNTYLDTLCKGGQMDLAKMVLEEMPSKRVWPSVVTFSIMMDGYAKANRLENALNLYGKHAMYFEHRKMFEEMKSRNTYPK